MAYSDLDADRLVNVNLLTTLAGPRIEKLVQDKTSTSTYRKFSAARIQAQKEVLAAFRIYNSTDMMPCAWSCPRPKACTKLITPMPTAAPLSICPNNPLCPGVKAGAIEV
jgi:hypothetical protein